MSSIKFKRIHPDAKAPSRGHSLDAGADLVATSVSFGGTATRPYVEYGTGIVVEVPRNHVGLLFARSSCTNKGLILGNAVGVIDSQFRGEIKARFYFENKVDCYKVGDKVAQLVILPIELPTFVEDSVEDTVRGNGGFGSTGE